MTECGGLNTMPPCTIIICASPGCTAYVRPSLACRYGSGPTSPLPADPAVCGAPGDTTTSAARPGIACCVRTPCQRSAAIPCRPPGRTQTQLTQGGGGEQQPRACCSPPPKGQRVTATWTRAFRHSLWPPPRAAASAACSYAAAAPTGPAMPQVTWPPEHPTNKFWDDGRLRPLALHGAGTLTSPTALPMHCLLHQHPDSQPNTPAVVPAPAAPTTCRMPCTSTHTHAICSSRCMP